MSVLPGIPCRCYKIVHTYCSENQRTTNHVNPVLREGEVGISCGLFVRIKPPYILIRWLLSPAWPGIRISMEGPQYDILTDSSTVYKQRNNLRLHTDTYAARASRRRSPTVRLRQCVLVKECANSYPLLAGGHDISLILPIRFFACTLVTAVSDLKVFQNVWYRRPVDAFTSIYRPHWSVLK